jgi:short-subunit dehydrogenase
MNAGTTRELAVVTGASSGIGLELAKELAARGFDVVVAAEDAAIEDPELFDGEGIPVLAVRVDLAEPEGAEQLVARVRELGRPVDLLAVNAGVGVGGSFVGGDLTAHLKLVDLNVRSAVQLAGLLLPGMVDRGDGAILFTSSIAATMPGPYASTYNASKSFLLSFAEGLRAELADSGVSITALMPGPTDTNFFERAGIEDTKLGQAKKDDARDVARDGLDAMFEGKDHVVAGSLKNKAQVAAAKVLPDRTLAAMHAKVSEPGSGR